MPSYLVSFVVVISLLVCVWFDNARSDCTVRVFGSVSIGYGIVMVPFTCGVGCIRTHIHTRIYAYMCSYLLCCVLFQFSEKVGGMGIPIRLGLC